DQHQAAGQHRGRTPEPHGDQRQPDGDRGQGDEVEGGHGSALPAGQPMALRKRAPAGPNGVESGQGAGMLTLLGVAVVVVGFAVRLNPLLVVVLAAFVTGWAAGLTPVEVLAAFGKAFNENRFVSAAYLVLPVIGVVERAGLQERARTLIGRFRGVSVGPLLVVYLLFRQLTSALGLTSIAGQTQSIRPIVAPMAEGAVEARGVTLDDATRQDVRAMAAATDNVGL